MFNYKTFEEATKMKTRISKALIGIDKNVVSVATREEKIGDSVVYSVKIGIENGINEEKTLSILKHLADGGIQLASSQMADIVSTFVEAGPIVAFNKAYIGSDDITKTKFLASFKNFFNVPQNQQYTRPVRPGISIGHVNVTAGTVGAILTDQNGIHYILSNNHVLANSNSGKKGDKIIQPGSVDSGKEDVAKLEFFVPIDMQCSKNIENRVDVALATLNDQTKLNCAITNIGEVNNLGYAHIGMKVEKSGRTTGYTKGEITAIDADITVRYYGQEARFVDQIQTTRMSNGGDSGSLLIAKSNNDEPKAVGLIFAGDPHSSFANHYAHVNSSLKREGYHTSFAKSTANVNKDTMTLLYKNRTTMKNPFALVAVVGAIGLASYAYNNRNRRFF